MTERLIVDDLAFDVQRSSRRKTVELTVDRGGELRISAPPEADTAWLEGFVREKRFWLYTKLAEKELLQHPVTERQFVTGESYPYLGRSYRILLVDEQSDPLKLVAGRFRLRRDAQREGRQAFVAWYSNRATEWLRQRVREWAPRMESEPQALEVRDLGFRWGSCARGSKLFFHWATILLPPSIIDYVIVHELAHLHEANHTPEFWRRVRRALPTCDEQRAWLAQHGGRHTAPLMADGNS